MDMREKVKEDIDTCCDYVIEICSDINDDVCSVSAADIEDLPRYVNVDDPAAKVLLEARLKNEPVTNFEPFHEILMNNSFDVEDYRYLGVNDGMLMVLAEWAESLGMDSEAERARSAVYSFD